MRFQKPREIAFRVLQQREIAAEYTEDLLDRRLAAERMSSADRSLTQELTYGVVRWQRALDWLIDRKTDDRPQKPALRHLLRLGLYQLLWLDRIPDHAAVHETVEMAKWAGVGAQTGFINAVLRSYTREKAEAKSSLQKLQKDKPAIGLSHPDWLYERWKQRWGDEGALRLMHWNNTPAKPFARVNSLKIDPGKLLSQWREIENVDYDFFRRDWTGENQVFEIRSSPPLTTLSSFRDGYFYVQDPSTLLAVDWLNPQPGEHVLDLCAAPGGKTTFIAQLMQNQGRVVAHDIREPRRQLLRQNCQRLGVGCVEVVSSLPEATASTFDRVLVDAPCSNTGVMRRRIDLKWRIQPTELPRLSALQFELLETGAARVKPGGTLVYSTCSLEPEENSEVVNRFLSKHPEFNQQGERSLLPWEHGVDGAYVARLLRTRGT